MRKFGFIAVSIFFCLSIAFIFPHSGETSPTIKDCSGCHEVATLHDDHNTQFCSICHNSHNEGEGIMPFSSKCTTCHPLDGSPTCDLISFHDLDVGEDCLTCHSECDFSPTAVDDSDNDGITDDIDNCPLQANGPDDGTCTAGKLIGEPCVTNRDCGGCKSFCSMNQEDTDEDGIGDACDN